MQRLGNLHAALAAAVLIGAPAALVGQAAADQVFNDDVIIIGSLCVGTDCANGESFGFDTIRLKENNTRIKFDDTSSSGSFPNHDWQLTANDSANGGQEKFSIEDITAGRVPFTIEGSSLSNSIYVDSTGRIGFRTTTPVLDLHVATGNTPGLRLEQNSSSGFTAQTWDLAGNEANFFVRDVTNGSKLPLKIQPNAPTNSLVLEAATGDVGVGTLSPTAPLHVARSNGTASILVQETSGTAAGRGLLTLTNNGGSFITMTNTATSASWFFTHENNAPNRFLISHSTGGLAFALTSTGSITIPGTITTGGGTCGGGCDRVFDADFPRLSIEEHAERMWSNRYLPTVGPTREGAPFDLTDKVGRMLSELEQAHIYIAELNARVSELEGEQGVTAADAR